jgi:cytochrome b6-f complex iron-sulfur subunit
VQQAPNNRPATRPGPAKDPTTTRRWILRWGVIGALGAVTAWAGAAFAIFFWPTRVGAFGGRVIAGRPDTFEVGQPRYVRDGKFYLMRLPDGFLALYQKCTHLGCVVPWRPTDPSEDDIDDQGRFNCPCHGSIFARFGVLQAGPAPRPMDIMSIDLVGENLVVNTGNITERSQFEPGQLFRL